MKGQVAAEVSAAISLASSGWRPSRGALKLVVTADEEMGAALGAKWLCEEHPEAVRCEMVVNEGGGASFELGGRRFYPLVRRREGRQPLPAARPRARRPRLGSGARRQRAAEAGPGARAARATSRRSSPRRLGSRSSRRCSASSSTATDQAALEGAVERLRGLSAPLDRLRRRADAPGDDGPDQGACLREGQRDPLPRRGPGRLPGAARRRRRRGPRAADGPAGPARGRARGRVRRPGGRQQLAAGLAAGRRDRCLAGRVRPRRPAGPDRDGGLQRQPLVPQGLRLGDGVWVLPPARARPLPRGAADPQRRRAGGGRPTSSSRRASTPTSAAGCSDERRLPRPGRAEHERLRAGRGGADAPRGHGAAQRPADPRPDLVGGRRAAPGRRDRGRLGPEADPRPWPARLDPAGARSAAARRGDGDHPPGPDRASARRGCRSRTRP